jgi:hypothetical protein
MVGDVEGVVGDEGMRWNKRISRSVQTQEKVDSEAMNEERGGCC